jgi:hypothetical protein
MPMPARIRKSSNCACQGLGTVVVLEDAACAPSLPTWKNSQAPSRLMRDSAKGKTPCVQPDNQKDVAELL